MRAVPGLLAVFGLLAGCIPNVQGRLAADGVGDTSLGEPSRVAFDARLVEACGEAQLTDAGQRTVRRQPYVQQVEPSGAWVLWTEAARDARGVRITTPDGEQVAFARAEIDRGASVRGAQYQAQLTGLEPATIYCYELVGDGAPLSTRIGFRTAPRRGELTRFVAMGDLGARTDDQRAVLDQLRTLPFELTLITGDVAYESGTLAQFERNVFGVYGEVLRHVPWFPAIGNHDAKTDDAGPFREVFALGNNERWYSFDWGAAHVVVVDTEKLQPPQLRWLERDLAATDQPWTIVVGHEPPFSSGRHGSSAVARRTLVPIFERHGVDLVLLGHEHNYERTVPINGVTYVVTGGGGRGTRPVGSSSFTAHAAQVSHFVYGEATERELKLWAIDATGQVFDTLRLESAQPHRAQTGAGPQDALGDGERLGRTIQVTR